MVGLTKLILFIALSSFVNCSPLIRFQENIVITPSVTKLSLDPFSGYICFEYLECFYRNGTFSHIKYLPASPESIGTKFFLYKRDSPASAHELNYQDDNSFLTPKLDPNLPIKVLTHGFYQSSKSEPIENIKKVLLEEEEMNLILVDWENGARPPNYIAAAVNTELVGRQLALIVKSLVTLRHINPETIHFMGFSLGSHVSGFGGKWLRDKLSIEISRITGLDPASPFFEGYGPKVHLWKADAKFVDIIHTSAGTNPFYGEFGFTEPIGHVDFYPNGGNNQPKCEEADYSCNHQAALHYFVESFRKSCPFYAYPCIAGFEAYKRGHCFNCNWQYPCGEMGYSSYKSPGRGNLYLATSAESPYCGVDISVLIQSSRNQSSTSGSIIVNLVGAKASGTIDVTKSVKADLLAGHELIRVQALSQEVFPLVSLEIKYEGYKGWGVLGVVPEWRINAVHIVNEDRNHEFHYCGYDTKLPHDVTTTIKHGGCKIIGNKEKKSSL